MLFFYYRIDPLSLRVHGPRVGEAGLQGFEDLLELALLRRHEVQLMLEPLLVQPHRGHALVQRYDLLPVFYQELVPGVHLGRLVDEHLLEVLELHGPLVDVFLELPEGQAGASSGGARGVGHTGETGLGGASASESQSWKLILSH